MVLQFIFVKQLENHRGQYLSATSWRIMAYTHYIYDADAYIVWIYFAKRYVAGDFITEAYSSAIKHRLLQRALHHNGYQNLGYNNW